MTNKRALISVSDKTGIVELAQELTKLGWDIISTGGTKVALDNAGVATIAIDDVTGFPEMMDGRVKTLHPKIHGGLLARRDLDSHLEAAQNHEIGLIDLVVVNLYPFKETILRPDETYDLAVENIDIGGPSMLRAGAKNHQDVTVVTDPSDYDLVLRQISASGDTSYQTRFYLARKVFEHTAAYDALIAQYFLSRTPQKELPDMYTLTFDKVSDLRYGENPHQSAVFYKNAIPVAGSLSEAVQLNGKELSFNNIADADATICCLKEFSEPTVVAVKHANPCGVGSAETILAAWRKAFEADSVSIYGGIVASNREIDAVTAEEMSKVFLEVIIAPSYSCEALEILRQKKNLRVLELAGISNKIPDTELNYKRVLGGLLVQENDRNVYDQKDLKTVTKVEPDPSLAADMEFAMKVVKYVKSNAIVVVKNKQTLGIGPGQTNRIGSAQIAFAFAGEKTRGAVLGSDAFFPFADCVDAAHEAGIAAIIQPGGSVRDQESIDACDKYGIAMVFTGTRHFRH